MGSQGLLRLAATRCGGIYAKAPSRVNLLPSQAFRISQSTSTFTKYGEPSFTVFIPNCQRHFSVTARRLSPEDGQPRSSVKPRLGRWTYFLGFGLILYAAFSYYEDHGHRDASLLNQERFTTCQVVSNEPVSPTAFILTVRLPSNESTATNHAVVRDAWRHGLWSVEIKQPQLQIARNYTPLPPSPDNDHAEVLHTVHLRFFVRRYDSGETSTYLSRLRAGDPIELRGPHRGFDLARRLGPGSRRDLVFLAGGTGVAPALQAAARLLPLLPHYEDGEGAAASSSGAVRILWANRSAADCAGCARAPPTGATGWSWWPWGGAAPQRPAGHGAQEEAGEKEPASVLVREIRALQAAYRAKGRTLEVRCAVDEEGGAFRARDIMDAIAGSERLPVDPSASCRFHSQQQLLHSTDEADATPAGRQGDGARALERRCTCVGGETEAGRNLFMISGPDGFVSAYVGPKVWADGAERQGPVGGLVAELMRKNPAAWRDWLVLKQ